MKELMTKLRRSFFAGLLVLVPLAASLWILWAVVTWLTNWLPLDTRTPAHRMLALVVLVAVTTAIGWVTRLMIGKRLVSLSEELIARVPVLNRTYGFMKEISQTLLSGRKTVFQRVVLVEYPKAGTYAIGFVTSETRGETQAKTMTEVVNVFLPTTPNPTSGFLLLVPQEKVINLEMSVGDAMKMVISGGSVMPAWPMTGEQTDLAGTAETNLAGKTELP
ncbi:MAG: DUF502 domain-containing protein [Verrucomicrobia bacterium]|nr:DUF502 domain-containing protein [Verrucomicrobiota bacterium]